MVKGADVLCGGTTVDGVMKAVVGIDDESFEVEGFEGDSAGDDDVLNSGGGTCP